MCIRDRTSTSAREVTFPDADITVVGTTTTQTLTNKTLTSPVLNTPTIGTSFAIGSATITEAELEIIDGALCTTTELNTVADGDTSIGTTAVAAADGIVTNDGGTMRQTTAATFDTYFSATTKTLTNKTLTAPKVTTSVQASTDAADIVINQYDGAEVARIHDGATAATIETGALDLTAAAAGKGGFGFKRAVYNVTPGSDDQACVLTAAHSGAVIMVTGAGYDLDITLPVILAGEEGWHCTIVVTTAFSGTNNLEIGTAGAGTDNNDTIHLYTQVATAVTVDAAGDTVISAADIPAGTMFELLAVKGGAAEQWICKAYQISGTAPTTGTAPA